MRSGRASMKDARRLPPWTVRPNQRRYGSGPSASGAVPAINRWTAPGAGTPRGWGRESALAQACDERGQDVRRFPPWRPGRAGPTATPSGPVGGVLHRRVRLQARAGQLTVRRRPRPRPASRESALVPCLVGPASALAAGLSRRRSRQHRRTTASQPSMSAAARAAKCPSPRCSRRSGGRLPEPGQTLPRDRQRGVPPRPHPAGEVKLPDRPPEQVGEGRSRRSVPRPAEQALEGR